ncbi:hypothetical protein MULP_00193 [Mycobacterium liflandii 128FXT]|uniref:Uncharacterized protein n=1 Tax=Mycobacterium liflandii (strain 128FXT) TaxID=459424 RepID=L7V1B0_MYCL1|nr:hypothetical protein MULP_00193 [Mycobacterium liflandii 128FXT]
MQTVGIGDQEVLLICLVVPVVRALGLRTVAETAVLHHHQWDRAGQSLRPVDYKVMAPELPIAANHQTRGRRAHRAIAGAATTANALRMIA